jgi:hypothetical protein
MSGYIGGPGIGVGFTPGSADTVSTSTPEFPGAPIQVGTVFTASNGSQWVYVLAAGAITANDFVIVTTNSTWAVQSMTNTLAASKLGQLVGVAGATATSGQYLWMQTKGYRASVSAVTGMTGFTAARTTATAGRIDDTITGGTTVAITGVIILATAASNVAAALLNDPTVGAND